MVVRTTWLAVRALYAEQRLRPTASRSAAHSFEMELPISVSIERGQFSPSPGGKADADMGPRISPVSSQPRAD
jgi:hypothetical protein